MDDVHVQTGRQLVIVIDEWDRLMREKQGDHEEQRCYLDFLRLWLKDQPYVALCYMTGILPIKKCGTHSVCAAFPTIPRASCTSAGSSADGDRGPRMGPDGA